MAGQRNMEKRRPSIVAGQEGGTEVPPKHRDVPRIWQGKGAAQASHRLVRRPSIRDILALSYCKRLRHRQFPATAAVLVRFPSLGQEFSSLDALPLAAGNPIPSFLHPGTKPGPRSPLEPMDSMKPNFTESLIIPYVSEGFLDPAGSEAGNGKNYDGEGPRAQHAHDRRRRPRRHLVGRGAPPSRPFASRGSGGCRARSASRAAPPAASCWMDGLLAGLSFYGPVLAGLFTAPSWLVFPRSRPGWSFYGPVLAGLFTVLAGRLFMVPPWPRPSLGHQNAGRPHHSPNTLAPTKDLKVPPGAWVLEGGDEGTEDMEGGEYVEGAEHGEGIGRRGSRM
eukprot:gene10216-biopygen4670